MKPGRAPKPTALKLVQGNPGRRPINKAEVSPEIAAPDCPDHLHEDARAEWNRIMPLLLQCGLITLIDSAALALYCQAFGRWQVAERKIAEMRAKGGDGMMVKAPSGYPIQNPYLAIANRAMEDCHRYLQAFGMSPSSRTRATAVQGDSFGGKKKDKNYFA